MALDLDDDDQTFHFHSRESGPNITRTSAFGSDLPSFASTGIELELEDNEENETKVKQLMRVWMNERLSPDLLPWQGELVEQILTRLQEQVCMESVATF